MSVAIGVDPDLLATSPLIDHALDAVIAGSERRRSRPGRRAAASGAVAHPDSTVTPARTIGAGLAPERRAGG
jgi:hypothetical protein